MTNISVVLLLAALGGFFYRCRGGFLWTGHTQVQRLLFWVAPVSLVSFSLLLSKGEPLFTSLSMGVMAGLGGFLGLMIPHGQWFNAETKKDVLILSGIGFARGLLMALPIIFVDLVAFILPVVASSMGILYRLAWSHLDGIDSKVEVPAFSVLGIQIEASRFALGGTEWAEVLFGAVIGLSYGIMGIL